jgi:hypothetical protein
MSSKIIILWIIEHSPPYQAVLGGQVRDAQIG